MLILYAQLSYVYTTLDILNKTRPGLSVDVNA